MHALVHLLGHKAGFKMGAIVLLNSVAGFEFNSTVKTLSNENYSGLALPWVRLVKTSKCINCGCGWNV